MLLTLSASQTLTVLSAEDVASLNALGLKRTSVIHCECSSSVDFTVKESVHHNVAWVPKAIRVKKSYIALLGLKLIIAALAFHMLMMFCRTILIHPIAYFSIMSTSSQQFSIRWKVAAFNFACTCRNNSCFLKGKAYGSKQISQRAFKTNQSTIQKKKKKKKNQVLICNRIIKVHMHATFADICTPTDSISRVSIIR